MDILGYEIKEYKTPGSSHPEYSFFYKVNGETLKYKGDFKALELSDVFNRDFDYIEGEPESEYHLMLFLNCCSCGDFYCDGIRAEILEKDDSVIWRIHRNEQAEIIAEYKFDKEQYENSEREMQEKAKSIIRKIYQKRTKDKCKSYICHYRDGSVSLRQGLLKDIISEARKCYGGESYVECLETGEIFDRKERRKEKKNHHEFLINPDYGPTIGEVDGESFGAEDDDTIAVIEDKIIIKVPGVYQWTKDVMCAFGSYIPDIPDTDLSFEALDERGLKLAKEIRAKTPENIDVKYRRLSGSGEILSICSRRK